MDVKLGGQQVPMDISAGYNGDPAIIGQVAKFHPFSDWSSRFKVPEDIEIEKVEIEGVDLMVQRIAGVRVSVHLKSSSGDRYRESLSVAQERQTNLLVVVKVEDEEYALLVSEPRVSMAAEGHYSIPTGILSAEFESQCTDLLAQLGIPTSKSDYTPLVTSASTPLLYPGANGAPTQTYHTVTVAEKPEFLSQFPIADGPVSAKLVPLSEISTTTRCAQTLAALCLFKNMKA
eukprot:TRINITY_DN16817_c0_g1_i1.p1 TRINITY_DN16817_c0_g1~~TRINITY_DN16817_c0_g1_i1.p1  ORF type:complete len:232 (+),score=41.03 TRINITY_DN16817_c0_g1_i1:46-741(+)